MDAAGSGLGFRVGPLLFWFRFRSGTKLIITGNKIIILYQNNKNVKFK